MNDIREKRWIVLYIFFQVIVLLCISFVVIYIDPYFAYHKPNTNVFKYNLGLGNERLVDLEIAKNFDYDAIILGTSMTENFKVTECENIYGVDLCVKTPVSGAKYNDVNNICEIALKYHPDLKLVIRGLDTGFKYMIPQNATEDLTYPYYLFDENKVNDINYLLNKDVLIDYCLKMSVERMRGTDAGITSFDTYANWAELFPCGRDNVLNDYIPEKIILDGDGISEIEQIIIKENIEENVVSLCEKYPETQFYFFYPPYSIVSWAELGKKGQIYKQIDMQRYASGLILSAGYENVHLFDFALMPGLITNLDNYKDAGHYGEHINSLMLKLMHKGEYELTIQNYESYYEELYREIKSFEFESLDEEE